MIIIFVFTALAPVTGGASLELKIIGTASTTSGSVSSTVNNFKNNNGKFLKSLKEEENRLKRDVENLENYLILYLTAIKSSEDKFTDELTLFERKFM